MCLTLHQTSFMSLLHSSLDVDPVKFHCEEMKKSIGQNLWPVVISSVAVATLAC